MTKVITYGTYDLLHYGHIRLLERAKALGDYLIVAVTAEDYDKNRGKINVQQSLMERIEAVRATGLADEIIIEEYEGQKIDDIKRYDVDIFTVGSDWIGKFDYLNQYCKVVYLDRTEGISSTELRSKKANLKIGLVGENDILIKYLRETSYVNGLDVTGIYSDRNVFENFAKQNDIMHTKSYEELLELCDAVYIVSHPSKHYLHIKQALLKNKHVLCESPVTLSQQDCEELFALAKSKNLILMDAIKTAYATAYNRLILLVKSGKIGRIVSVDATCTSMRNLKNAEDKALPYMWNSICAWGPTALLPIFQILGTDYIHKNISTCFYDEATQFDAFTKIDFLYKDAVASLKVGQGVKSEGELIISGTKGYIYVPAPWWKTDYFEIRYENPEENRRHYYQLDGEGIRYELVAFVKAIETKKHNEYVPVDVSRNISEVMEAYYNNNFVTVTKLKVD